MTETPAFYDDLAGCLAEAWRGWRRGGPPERLSHAGPRHDRPRRRPAPAHRGAARGRPGGPVVARPLRRPLRQGRRDRRRPRVSLHAYDPKAKIQVRIEGTARLHGQDAVARAAWAASRPMSRIGYATAPGPGTPPGRGRRLRPAPRRRRRGGRFCGVPRGRADGRPARVPVPRPPGPPAGAVQLGREGAGGDLAGAVAGPGRLDRPRGSAAGHPAEHGARRMRRERGAVTASRCRPQPREPGVEVPLQVVEVLEPDLEPQARPARGPGLALR